MWGRVAMWALLPVTGLAGPAVPNDPGYYEVANVAEDDVLNVRAGAGAHNEKVGELPPGVAPVEVVRVRDVHGNPWGQVRSGERSGWVAMRFLQPVELEGVKGTDFPQKARCYGTEPSWGLRFEDDSAVVRSPTRTEIELSVASAAPAAGRLMPIRVTFAEGRGHAVVHQGVCSDGMSDIPHGWSVNLILSDEDGQDAALFTGCCSVPRPAAP